MWIRVVALLALLSGRADADTFLGVESEDETAGHEEEAKASSQTSRGADSRMSRRGASTDADGAFAFSGGFQASSRTLGGQATVGYWFNRFVGTELTYSYHQIDTDEDAGVMYGPDLAAVLRGSNPTILTPFVGAGPGHVKWQRSHGGEVFDAGSAMTGNAFAGVNVRLARHFGLQLVRRQTVWLQTPPKTYADRSTREEKSRLSTGVGFYMAF